MPRKTRAWWALDAVIVLASMLLATGRRMQFLDATFDDALFARLANSLRDGAWLGPYDKLTLAKGPGYPAFLALVSAAGLPLRLAEQAVYLLGCWLVARVAGRLARNPALAAAMFAAAALNPVPWGVSLDRVVRENLYLGLTPLVLGLAAATLLDRHTLPRRLLWGALLGAAFGWFWLTREEGLWLAPALSVLAADWLLRPMFAPTPSAAPAPGTPGRRRLRAWGAAALVLLVPALSFAAIDLGVAARNKAAYGVAETTEFRSPEFKAAYGALSRIEHAHWQRLIPVPKDARAAAYAASPAAQQLAAGLDGPNGAGWTAVGCSWLPIEPCQDIQSGWFMWALRDAAEIAGHTRSAPDARRFYAAVAAQVNAACDSGALRCGPPRTGFLPPMRREYLPFIAHDAGELALLLARLGAEPPGDACSDGNPAAIAAFRRVALGPWSPPGTACHPEATGTVRLLGWALAANGPVQLRVLVGGVPQPGALTLAGAPDVPIALHAPGAQAIRLNGTVHCGGAPCSIEVGDGQHTAQADISALSPGYAVNTGALRLWLDAVEPVQPGWSRPQRTAATALSAVLRTASLVLLPLAVLLLPVILVWDLVRRRTIARLSVLWLALLAAMATRIALLAVLNATSLPAVAPLYLSPAIGLALLFTAGVLGDAAARLARRPHGRRL